MNHMFDVSHAQKHGVGEAIFIQNLAFWIQKNSANGRHCHEGKTWTYNSVQAHKELFPYWSEKQIRRIIESLLEQGVILTHQKPTESVAKVTWFAFVDESCFLKSDLPKRANPSAQKGKRSAQKGKSSYSTDNYQISTQIVSARSPLEEMRAILNKRYNRLDDDRWDYLEESELASICKRIRCREELSEICGYFDKLPQNEKRFSPRSISSLLSKWTDTLDRARAYDVGKSKPWESNCTDAQQVENQKKARDRHDEMARRSAV